MKIPNCGRENTPEEAIDKLFPLPENSIPDDSYFTAWCEEYGVTQADPWKIPNTTEIQTVEEAAKEFARAILLLEIPILMRLAKDESIIVTVQSWQGIISKCRVTVKLEPIYYAERIE